jgi:hypothetical protein
VTAVTHSRAHTQGWHRAQAAQTARMARGSSARATPGRAARGSSARSASGKERSAVAGYGMLSSNRATSAASSVCGCGTSDVSTGVSGSIDESARLSQCTVPPPYAHS